MPIPLSVLIKPASSRCNLRCTYCFYLEKQALYPWRNQPKMSIETFQCFLEQYAAVSAPYFAFAWQGGEPTLMGLHWFQQVVAAQQQAARTWQARSGTTDRGVSLTNAFQTNGTLLDDDWARFFREHHFLVGVSIDGPPEWHDTYRTDPSGRATHERVLAGIDCLRRHGVEFNVLVVVSRANVARPRDLVRYFVRQGLTNLQFIPCVERTAGHPAGAAREQVAAGEPANTSETFASYSITPDEYGTFLSGLFDGWMEVGYARVRIRLFDNLLQMILGMPSEICQLAPACGYVVLEYNGDCYPCDFFVESDWKLGNIHETPLPTLLEGERFQQFVALKPQLHEACRRCHWRPLCHGECPRYRILRTGEAAGQLPYFCCSYQQFFGRRYKRLARVADQVRRNLEMTGMALPPVVRRA